MHEEVPSFPAPTKARHARTSSDLSASFAATGGPIRSDQVLGGKSREELERMLLQADEMILRKEKGASTL
jgi:hypothetical protein